MGEAKRRAAGRAGTPLVPAPGYPGDDWNVAERPAVVAGKSCGSCTTCCTVMGVREIEKPAWEECPHVAAGLGCKIYSDRPSACRKFTCGWLLDPQMGPDLKPEHCHVVFHQINGQNIFATCDANYPDAWRKPNVLEFLHRLAGSVPPDRRVILMEKGRTWFVNQHAIVPVDTG